MKKSIKALLFMLISLVVFIPSCVQEMPYVEVVVSKWDDNTESWVELKSKEGQVIHDKKYIYGQRFKEKVTGHTFTRVVRPIDPNDPDKGNIVRKYTFDGKTWSFDSRIGDQDPIGWGDGLTESINEVYAYYTYKDVPEMSFVWHWELVDPAQYVYSENGYNLMTYTGTSSYTSKMELLIREDNSNWSENANRTIGMSKPIEGRGRYVTNAPIPTRRGYKFMGWTTKTNMNINNSKEQSECILDPEYPPATSFPLDYKHGYIIGENYTKATLYAVWEPDYESGYWAKIDNKYVPDTFNLEEVDNIKNLGRKEKRNMFSDYPYYNEVHYPSSGLVAPWVLGKNPSTRYRFDHDFAIADSEFTVYTLHKLNEWNDEQYSKWQFDLPTAYQFSAGDDYDGSFFVESKDYPVTPTPAYNYVRAGYKKNNSGSRWWDSRYDSGYAQPLCSVHIYQAILIANAMTAYYNDHNENEKDLTYAYNKKDGTPVRTISEAEEFYESFYVVRDKEIRGDIEATGFRLPTIQEWQFAARVMPESVHSPWETENNKRWTNTEFVGSSYPQFQWYYQPSGSTNRATKYFADTSSVDASNNQNITWNSYSSASNSSRTLYRVRGLYNDEGYNHGYSIDKPVNFSGLYNMNGNVAEYVDYITDTDDSDYVLGGSVKDKSEECYVTKYELVPMYSSGRAKADTVGFRLCRTVNLK